MSFDRYPPVVLAEWVDATNMALWTDVDDLADWAEDGGYLCRNVGYLVHEDDECIVLAGRIALRGEPQQVGIFERIPKGVLLTRQTLRSERPLKALKKERP